MPHLAIHTARNDLTARAGARLTRVRTAGLMIAAGCLSLALAGCVPEPGTGASTPTPQPSVSQQPSVSPSELEATPSATAESVEAQLPSNCEAMYSPGMLQSLTEQNPPLNDPAVTMTSTEVVAGLEVLHSGAPTIRCSWGAPSGFGLATNVTIVTPAQTATVEAALRERGFSCTDSGAAPRTETRCEITERFNDPNLAAGETHVLRANGWISTHWLNFAPPGYTDDIVAQLFS